MSWRSDGSSCHNRIWPESCLKENGIGTQLDNGTGTQLVSHYNRIASQPATIHSNPRNHPRNPPVPIQVEGPAVLAMSAVEWSYIEGWPKNEFAFLSGLCGLERIGR
jgi:hypothetical protein